MNDFKDMRIDTRIRSPLVKGNAYEGVYDLKVTISVPDAGGGILDVRAEIDELISMIPEPSRESATIDFIYGYEADPENDLPEMVVSYVRPETAQEQKDRIEKARAWAEKTAESERAHRREMYERLRKEFEEGGK